MTERQEVHDFHENSWGAHAVGRRRTSATQRTAKGL